MKMRRTRIMLPVTLSWMATVFHLNAHTWAPLMQSVRAELDEEHPFHPMENSWGFLILSVSFVGIKYKEAPFKWLCESELCWNAQFEIKDLRYPFWGFSFSSQAKLCWSVPVLLRRFIFDVVGYLTKYHSENILVNVFCAIVLGGEELKRGELIDKELWKAWKRNMNT